MKTGFVTFNAKYHYIEWFPYKGVPMICTKLPETEPFETYYTDIKKCRWEIIYERWPVKIGDYTLIYFSDDFIPSYEYKYCYLGFTDNLVRYYFFDIEYYNGILGHGWFILYANGKYCNWQVDSGFTDYFHMARFRYIWGRYNYLMVVQNPGVGTHIRIWRSTTRDLPDYWPVPPTT